MTNARAKVNIIRNVCSSNICLGNRLRIIKFYGTLLLAELIFKIGSLNLFITKLTFRYRKMLKFRVLARI